MDYRWEPITQLSEQDKNVGLNDVDALKSVWTEVRARLAESSSANLKNFNERLARQWSIETGILERIYDLDRGTTLVLIEMGFLASLVERSSTDRDPTELIEILRDHKAAVDLVQDCVANSRPLTIGLIHELHSTLTRHQETVEALDQFGNPVSFPLKRGAFKDLPNNPKRPDRSIHEYCPPIHVASEMDNLLRWYSECSESVDINPVLLAAWLHHRFTQIHPYQDGNGRIARVLANLVLVKSQLFPVVINRDHRPLYIEALEQADLGNIKTLTRLFATIEKKTILEAISLPPDQPSTAILEDVADAIGLKFRTRREEATQKLRHVNTVAEKLQGFAEDHMDSLAQSVATRLRKSADLGIGIQVIRGGPNQLYYNQPTEHWYHFQVVKTAQETHHRINFNESHYFVRTRLSKEGIPGLTFVISFHHIGQELSGVMEITAFAEISYPATGEDPAITDPVKCMDKPFTMTYQDNADVIKNRFLDWANESFTLAVKIWGDVL